MAAKILAVFVGVVVWSLLWVAVNAGLQATMPGSFGDDGMTASQGVLLILLACSVAASLVSGYATSRMAPTAKPGHVLWTGGVLLAIGTGVQGSVWSQMPVWYHLIFLGLLLPLNVLGGWLQRAKASTAELRSGHV